MSHEPGPRHTEGRDRDESDAGWRVDRTLLWRRTDRPGLEHFRLLSGAEGPRLAGTVLLLLDDVPLRVEYTVDCTPDWRTRLVRATSWRGDDAGRRVELKADGAGRWWRDGREARELAGCLDVDLSVTPSTNTLPIRRLALAPGVERDVTAAWIRFPALAVEPLAQRYARASERVYTYESRGGAFSARLQVDELGLVVRYPPAWERA
ncbi:MAG: putative glycolipid-binding domain-containing protein [Gemmatimonadaceae bacterium]